MDESGSLAASQKIKKEKKKEKKKEGTGEVDAVKEVESESLKLKKDQIKGEKKLEKKKEKEERKKLKEEEKQKEREEKIKEKEDKRKAEKQRELRKEQRKSWLKQGGGGFNSLETDPIGIEIPEVKEGKEKKVKNVQCPEVKRRQRELEQYLLNMPIKRLRGTTWQYYDIAPASGYTESMVVLHVGGARPEIMYEHILGLAQGFRVVAPWFPEEFTEMEDYVAGIFLILRHENIKKSHFFGIGFGSVVALQYLSRHPGRVLTCTLAHCSVPSDEKIRYVEKAIRKMDVTQNGPLRKLMAGCMVKPKDIEEHVFDLTLGEKEMWMRNFKNFGATKQAVFSRLEALLDYHAHYSFKPANFERWDGKMLLIESEDDEYIDSETSHSLKELFPDATQYCIKNSGHLVSLIRGKTIVDRVLRFALDEESYLDVTSKADISPQNSVVEEYDELEDNNDDNDAKKEKKKEKPSKEEDGKKEKKEKDDDKKEKKHKDEKKEKPSKDDTDVKKERKEKPSKEEDGKKEKKEKQPKDDNDAKKERKEKPSKDDERKEKRSRSKSSKSKRESVEC